MADATRAGLADSMTAFVDRRIALQVGDGGIGTVTAVNPGGTAGTVSVDTGSGTGIKMRRAAGYSPTVADLAIWILFPSGDYVVVDKLA